MKWPHIKMDTLLSTTAVVVSIISFIFSFSLSRDVAVSQIRPAIVFLYDGGSGWSMQNIGNGPALNIIIAKRQTSGDWFEPVRVPPVAAGAGVALDWIGHSNIRTLGAIYQDFEGRYYSSFCQDDLSSAYEGRQLPIWPESEIKKHWQMSW